MTIPCEAKILTKSSYIETIASITLVTLDAKARLETCGYWYLIRHRGMAHTAFRHRNSFLLWLDQRGLSLTEELPPHGTFSWQNIKGIYRKCSHMDKKEFQHLKNVHSYIRVLSNGDWTMGKITLDEDGYRTVHYLNPNVPRKVYNYQLSSEMYG